MARHLLAISFGPVQPFIAAARKTRDLKAGSDLLLQAVRASAKAILEADSEAKLIFPAATLESIGTADAANIILAEIHAEPRSIENAARKAFEGELNRLWRDALGRIQKKEISGIQITEAERQLGNTPEIYAAWVEFPEGSDYSEARKVLGARMAGRKALRDFAPARVTESGQPKSPLNPDLEGILPTDGMTVRQDVQDKLLVKPRETLDAFSLIKRQMQEEGDLLRFPSTRSMVIADWLKDNQTESSVENLTEWCKEQKVDLGDVLLDQLDELDDDLKVQARQRAREVRKATGTPAFRGYYAMLMADGDSVGKFLDSLNSPEEHKAFSKTLGEFAHGTKDIVKKHLGELIYSGGDDVLAFMPASKAIECAQALELDFKAKMHSLGKASPPTLSVAIRIHHHADDLQGVVRACNADLKSVKRAHTEKNHLRVTVAARSGSDQATDHSFAKSSVSDLKALIEAHEKREVPRGWAYELRDWSEMLKLAEVSSEHILNEYKRIAERKTPKVKVELPESYRSQPGLAKFAQAAAVAQFLTREGGASE